MTEPFVKVVVANSSPPPEAVMTDSSKDLPLTRLLPNILTLMSLCSGLTGIRFALLGRWQEAALAIFIASIFDILDGRVARMLSLASKFGAELDSLSDAIAFGVAPGFIMYQWALKDEAGLGWIAVLIYVVCAVLRLARFNVMTEEETVPPWGKAYFTGIPAPGGAGLALWPLFMALAFGDDFTWPQWLITLWMVFVAGLMISRVPSLALKGWRVGRRWVVPIFVSAVLLVAALVTHPFITLSGIGFSYLLSLPIGWLMYRNLWRRYELSNDHAG